MNVSSDWRMLASDSCGSEPSAVVPLFPVVGEPGLGWVAAEEEGKQGSEGGFVLALGEELGDAFEGHDPAEGLDNKPEIRQRRRTFHIV